MKNRLSFVPTDKQFEQLKKLGKVINISEIMRRGLDLALKNEKELTHGI